MIILLVRNVCVDCTAYHQPIPGSLHSEEDF